MRSVRCTSRLSLHLAPTFEQINVHSSAVVEAEQRLTDAYKYHIAIVDSFASASRGRRFFTCVVVVAACDIIC